MQENGTGRTKTSPLILVGVAAIAALALSSMLSSYNATHRNNEMFHDPYEVAKAEERLAAAAARIPATATVGYFSDVKMESDSGRSLFFAAQYALAPRLLVEAGGKVKYEYAIRESHSPVDLTSAGAAHGLKLVTDFGNGVALFKKAGQ
jgi:hypothetical protein